MMKKLEFIKFSLFGNMPTTAGGVPLGPTALLIGIVGALVRIRFYYSFGATSLSRDEAALALNFVDAGFLDLLKPLRLGQAAPIGFLLAEKAVEEVFGSGELSLRLLSLATSILIIPLFYLLVRHLLSPVGVLVGLTIVVLSEPLIVLGTTFKQYSLDAFVALVLLNLGRSALPKGPGNARYVVCAVIGAAAVWFSFPSVFVLGGLGLTAIASALLDGRRREAVSWVATMSVCAVSFGLAYFLSFRHYAKSDTLSAWWTYAFAPMPPRSMGDVKWYIDNFFLLFPSELGLREAGLCGALLLFGMYSLWIDPARRAAVSLFLSPIILTLIASGLHKYPFGDRTMTFSSPLLATLVAAGVAAVWEVRERTAKVFAAIIVGTMLLHPLYVGAKYMIDPHQRVVMDVKPTLAYVADHRKDGDVLYVHWDAETLYDYYVKKRDFRNMKDWRSVISQHPGDVSRGDKIAAYAKVVSLLGPSQRVWFLTGIAGQAEAEVMLDLLERRGTRLDEFHGIGSAAYLYDLGPEGAGGFSHESIGQGYGGAANASPFALAFSRDRQPTTRNQGLLHPPSVRSTRCL